MYDVTREELVAAVEAEERAWLSTDDIHPYKSRVPQTKGNTVSFPKITRFSTYLLRHYGAEIVEEINGLLYDGELAAICGVDGFHSQQLMHDHCRIDPRMTFWRVNKYEFTADLVVYLKASVYNDDDSSIECFTLYVSLDFCIDDRMTYRFGNVSLQQPERDRMKLDDYLIPILNIREVDVAAEKLWFEYMPEALHDYRLLDPFKLANKMGLEVAYHRLFKNTKTKSMLFWFDSEIEVTPEGGDDKAPPAVVKVPAGTILINENAVHRDRARLNVYHECFHDEYHWLFYQLQEMHNNDLRKIKRTRKTKNQGKEPKNPLTILEWEAKQGSRALMMPERIVRPMIEQYKTEERKIHNHAGLVFQGVGYSIFDVMDIPKYLIRGRMIQLGYWQAQGALNYIQTNPLCGRYITPFTFSRESCPTTAHTFVISPEESFKLYEKNKEYRARLDTGDYVYVEGHVCLNDPAYIVQTPIGPRMTNWANRHVDECCLRFENVYEVDENYEFHLNSINSDEEYNRHYIDFAVQGKELSAKEATEEQSKIIAALPDKPGEALKALMKLSGNIGYDQYQRNTLYKEAEKFGFDTAKVTTPVETDCSALVRVCCAFAGIVGLPEGFRTGNMPTNLSKTGAFTELTGSKYQEQSTYLGRGDILVTKTSGHTVVVLSNGSKYEGTVKARDYAIGDRVLKYGCEGGDVKILQEALLKLGYDLGKWGCDGDFGDCTELALEAFQKKANIDVDGECGPQTLAALREALSALEEQKPTGRTVLISGGNCYIRTAPNTTGKIVGVAHNGDKLSYGGETSDGGWPMVEHNGQNAWVSGKYGRLIDE